METSLYVVVVLDIAMICYVDRYVAGNSSLLPV